MLTGLSIRNVVLIEALDLAFPGGLGVLTGETGAGKSILLDSLGLILGDRADSGLVRTGTDQASVTATFEFAVRPEGVAALLEEAEIAWEAGEPLLIRRRLKADGEAGRGSTTSPWASRCCAIWRASLSNSTASTMIAGWSMRAATACCSTAMPARKAPRSSLRGRYGARRKPRWHRPAPIWLPPWPNRT
jgi:energy-coupling factor transporter ATP-binding protein EcfA2